MSSLPPDPADAPRSGTRAQVLLNSPLAAAPRMLGYQAWRRPQPPMLWRRVIGWTGSLLAQLIFLFAFVLGPAYEPPPAQEVPAAKMQLRFVEVPDVTPPKGEVPRKVGPVHRGSGAPTRRIASTAAARRSASTPVMPAKQVAAPAPAPSLPQTAADLRPVQTAVQTPPITLPTPSMQPPVPPKFQPKPLRAPQLEGNQPIPPPPSLALPEVPTPAAPTMAMPTPALDRVAPVAARPVLAPAMAVTLPPTAPDAAMPAVPVVAAQAPAVNLDATALTKPAAPAPRQLAKPQAPQIEVPAEQPLAAIPQATALPQVAVAPAPPTVRLHAPAAPAKLGHLAPVEVAPAADEAAIASKAKAAETGKVAADVSTAPNARPTGSDTATPGVPQGSAATAATGHQGSASTPAPGAGQAKGLIAPPGTSPQPGANGAEPDYVQLKPTGNTTIMEHKIKGIDYKPTKLDPYWTPLGESSVDTALRRAAEKTTIKHTFHLPRGIRIECKVMPLVPVALLGCSNPDPPPPPQPQKLYDRLNLPTPKGGAVPQVAPAATTNAPAPTAPVQLGDAALCAAARVSGGPLPPGCPPPDTPSTIKPVHPAPASSSWAPASDQFH